MLLLQVCVAILMANTASALSDYTMMPPLPLGLWRSRQQAVHRELSAEKGHQHFFSTQGKDSDYVAHTLDIPVSRDGAVPEWSIQLNDYAHGRDFRSITFKRKSAIIHTSTAHSRIATGSMTPSINLVVLSSFSSAAKHLAETGLSFLRMES